MLILIGQFFGILAFAATFLSYQAKTQKQVLAVQTASVVAITVHYLLIGASAGFVLNALCIVRNGVYFFKDRKPFSHPAVPYIAAAVFAAYGIITAKNGLSLLIAAGLTVNTVAVSKEPQFLRKSILITSTLVLIYNISVFSIGGIINETLAIVSAAVGIFRYRKGGKAYRT